MNKSPQTLKGFRDFLPQEKRARDWVETKITDTFKSFGFEPLETPTLEYADLLLGKYGQEADKLVFTFTDKGGRNVGLRYDQTVPIARVLGQYSNALPPFFRRFQIQNVFRADKPQKGRFREFTQCDIDIFGSASPLSDAEILACTFAAYSNIGFSDIKISLNNRQVLADTIKSISGPDFDLFKIIQILDKQDKIGLEGVIRELKTLGLSTQAIDELNSALDAQTLPDTLKAIIEQSSLLGVPRDSIIFNPRLARGLDYYTGMIFEVTDNNYSAGSLGGGGRYDNLIEQLTGQTIPAVGMAFGFDRTVEAAQELGLIPNQLSSVKVLITLFDQSTISRSLEVATTLRRNHISTEIYPQLSKIAKQFKLANQKNIPFVIVVGDQEVSQNKLTLKNLETGDQQLLTLDEVLEILQH